MALPSLVQGVAKAIYEYAGADGLPKWDDLAPTVQIYYVEEAEAAMKHISIFVSSLAELIDARDDKSEHVRDALRGVVDMIDPRLKFDFEI